jgi:hypothetical protein
MYVVCMGMHVLYIGQNYGFKKEKVENHCVYASNTAVMNTGGREKFVPSDHKLKEIFVSYL